MRRQSWPEQEMSELREGGCMKYLTEEEVVDVLDSTKNPRDYLMLRLLYQTGMRVSELANAKVEDINIDTGKDKNGFDIVARDRILVCEETNINQPNEE